jgi:hypothetical protein
MENVYWKIVFGVLTALMLYKTTENSKPVDRIAYLISAIVIVGLSKLINLW